MRLGVTKLALDKSVSNEDSDQVERAGEKIVAEMMAETMGKGSSAVTEAEDSDNLMFESKEGI